MRTTFPSRINVLIIVITALVFYLPDKVCAQKRLLIPSDTVTKVAYVDHSKLRKEYKNLVVARNNIAKENKAKQQAFERTIKLLEEKTAKQLESDRSSGGKEKEKIINNATTKQLELTSNYQAEVKQAVQTMATLMQQYERKIILAIDAVVSEGGFTDVKPFVKEPFAQRGLNITDSILKKLN